MPEGYICRIFACYYRSAGLNKPLKYEDKVDKREPSNWRRLFDRKDFIISQDISFILLCQKMHKKPKAHRN